MSELIRTGASRVQHVVLLEAENDWKPLVVGFYELASAEIVRFMGMISC